MKRQLKHVIVLLMVITAVGCSKDSEPTPTPVVQDTNHPAMGDWAGTFSGGDHGTWEMAVDKDGKFSGDVFSENGQTSYPLTGAIDDNGIMTAVIDINGVTLDFTGKQSGDQASGEWGNPSLNITGTWTGTKK